MRWLRSSSGFVSVGTAAVLVVSTFVALAGSGFKNSFFDLGDGFAWLANDDDGSIVLVNGETGEATGKFKLPNGGKMQLVRRDGHTYVMVDGKVLYRIGGNLGDLSSVELRPGQVVVRGGDRAWLVNKTAGRVQPIDPQSLAPLGDELVFDGAIEVGADDGGRLIVVEKRSGRAFVIDGDRRDGGTEVGPPNGQFRVIVIGGVPIVIIEGSIEVVVFRDGDARKVLIPEARGEVTFPSNGEGDELPVFVDQQPTKEIVFANLESAETRRVRADVPQSVTRPEVWSARDALYVVRREERAVYVIDPMSGALRQRVELSPDVGDPQKLDLFVKDGLLWVNNATSRFATVIDARGVARVVEKYDVPELNAPVTPPEEPATLPLPPPSEGEGPASPSIGAPPVAAPPGMPEFFMATAGNGSVGLTWIAPPDGGAPIERYNLRCSPDCGGRGELTIDGGAQSHRVEGLRNGTSYRFELSATNSIGTGPPTSAGPVTPTADVPLPPSGVTANEDVTGRVTVRWSPGSGEGHDVIGYDVTALDAQQRSVRLGRVAGTVAVFAAGTSELEFGTPYRFIVQTVSDATASGAVSEPSRPSNEVVPFAGPSSVELRVERAGGPRRVEIYATPHWRGKVGTLRLSGLATEQVEATRPGAQVAFTPINPPWGTVGEVTVEACVDSICESASEQVSVLMPTFSAAPVFRYPAAGHEAGCRPNENGALGFYFDNPFRVEGHGIPPEYIAGEYWEFRYGADTYGNSDSWTYDGRSGNYVEHGGWASPNQIHWFFVQFTVEGQVVRSDADAWRSGDC